MAGTPGPTETLAMSSVPRVTTHLRDPDPRVRVHNLRDIDVDIPRDRLVVLTGAQRLGEELAGLRHDLSPRGSGGTSSAFRVTPASFSTSSSGPTST